MTIRPVSSVSLVKTYNQLNFEGKKKKHSNSGHSSNPVSNRLAVPLAAALTMAPLNVMDAKGTHTDDFSINKNTIELVDDVNSVNEAADEKGVVIESKNFVSKNYGPYKINLISTDGDASTFEKVVQLLYNEYVEKELSHDVLELAQYNYQVISDDQSKGSNFGFKQVHVDSGMKSLPTDYNQDDIVNYIEKLIDDPRNNNAIKKVTHNRTIRPSTDGTFQNVAGKEDIMKNAVPYKPQGKLIESGDVEIDGVPVGKLRYYSTHGSDKDVELITYQKNGYPELGIQWLYANNHVFNPYSDKPSSFQTGTIVLFDGNNKRYCLEDPTIVFGLADLMKKNPDVLGKAVNGSSDTVNYLLTNIGVISPVHDEEK